MPRKKICKSLGAASGWAGIWLFLISLTTLPAQEFLYRHYQNNNELPNQFISSVMQAEDGRIWLSTRRGIVIYNGAEWEKLILGEKALTTEHFINGTAGAVWMLDRRLLSGLEIQRWQEQTPKHWSVPGNITRDPNESWVDGLVRTDENNMESLLLTTTPAGLITFSENTGWQRFSFRQAQTGLKITGLTPYYDSVLFSTTSGIFRFDGEALFSANEFNSRLPDTELLGVTWEQNGPMEERSLWIIGREWIQQIRQDTRRTYKVDFPQRSWDYASVISDQNGCLFILLKYLTRVYPPELFFFSAAEEKLEAIGRHTGLEGLSIQCITRDREKIIWMGTSRGLCKLVNPSFRTFRKEHGLLDDEVSAIHFYRDEVILGHNIGYTRYKAGQFSTRLFPPNMVRLPRVSNIDSDGRGNIYMACGRLGLLVIGTDGIERHFSLPDPTDQGIGGVCVDSVHGKVWTAADNKIYTFTGNSFRPEDFKLPDTVTVRNIQLLPNGIVTFLTNGEGVIAYDGGNWRQFKSGTDPRNNSVYYALLHPKYGLLLATSNGLCRLEDETLNPFHLGDSGLNDLCFSINLDQQGHLWIGTVNGVISWDGETLKRHRSSDGVPGHEINRNALKIAPDGRLWIGSNGGVSIYQPLIDQSGSLPPPRVILSELQVNQVSLPTEKPIRLDYNQNSFSFHFYCPSYINEFENRYRHRLQGYETEWREVSGKLLSHAYYQNIPSGTYTFEIMAANAYGEWGPISRTSTVIIRSPFWKSPVFVISFALLSILIPLWGVFTFVQKRNARRLEAEVRSRTEELHLQKAELERLNTELRQANTTKNKFFSIIAHDLRNPFTSLLTGTEFLLENFDTLSNEMKKKNSREIQQAAKLTYDLVNNLLDWSRTQIDRIEFVPSRIDLTRLIQQILRLVESDTGRKSLQITLLVPPRCDMLGDRHMIRFILRNLISNAVKFTPRGGHITITVYDYTDRWSIAIRDTGIGISPEKLEALRSMDTPFSSNGTEGERGTGLGLILCREFIQLHKGHLTITSQKDQGSLFTVSLPKGDIHPPRSHDSSAVQ